MYLRALTARNAKYESGGLLPSNKKKVRIKTDVRCQDKEVRDMYLQQSSRVKFFPFICPLAVKPCYNIL